MKEVKLGGHRVKIYDSIDELPIKRFHVYNKYLLIDAGIGSEISDFDHHIERMVAFLTKGDKDNANKELQNLRQNVYLIMNGQNIRHLSFACLVASIDGQKTDDISPDGLAKVLKKLGGVPRGEFSEAAASVKKKIDEELSLYFPAMFDDVRTREYYDIVKRMTVTMLEQLYDGVTDERKKAIETMQEKLVLFSKPKVFQGNAGLEVMHDKNFATMCLMITKEAGSEAKNMTVMEYYNAYEYIKQKARQTQNKAV